VAAVLSRSSGSTRARKDTRLYTLPPGIVPSATPPSSFFSHLRVKLRRTKGEGPSTQELTVASGEDAAWDGVAPWEAGSGKVE
jgi:hypothetical protein